ncbi:LOW QUALITY PROTEIN: uncharacterized protein O3C94_014610 [Discoglossus pictus]
MEKAFDTLEWSYLYAVLAKFGFEGRFIQLIRTLYTNPHSCLKLPGWENISIAIQRGTRQGCPLSPLLFALAIEPLAQKIICNTEIKGMQKHHCKSHSHILSLSLLLLLAAGDISPNPGPSLISTCFLPRSTPRAENTRKTQNLIPITCHKPSTLPFSCALWNARSICNKLTFTHDLFTTNSLNLLALTETWLSSSDTASPAALSHGGFHLSHTPRPGNKQGGGVGVLLSSRCTFHLIPPVPSLQFSYEAHTIRLFSPISLRVAVIYRPPGTSSQFLDHFSAWLPHFLSSNIPTLILGDFNIAIDTPTSSAAAKLLALTFSLGLSQLTDSSTHHAAGLDT